jgi:hypothetical protein
MQSKAAISRAEPRTTGDSVQNQAEILRSEPRTIGEQIQSVFQIIINEGLQIGDFFSFVPSSANSPAQILSVEIEGYYYTFGQPSSAGHLL